MRVVVLFQGASCATYVQRVIVLSTEFLMTTALVRQKNSYSYEACAVYNNIQGDLLA